MPQVLEGLWEEIEARRAELHGKRVRVIVLEEEPPVGSLERLFQTLERIHAQLQAAGHPPLSDEEALARIEAERRTWDEAG